MLHESQQKCLNHTVSGHNLLIAGQAGTGKMFRHKEIAEECLQGARKVAIVCTTGIATLNFFGSPATVHQ